MEIKREVAIINMYPDYTKDKIVEFEKKVDKFVNDKKIGEDLIPGFDIIKIAVRLNFQVYSMRLPSGVDGVILIDREKKIIGVNSSNSGEQARFVVAHELGHYIDQIESNPHSEILFAMKDSIFHNDKKNDKENEMDYLAAALLVPHNSLKQVLLGLNITNISTYKDTDKIEDSILTSLAGIYKVNKELIQRRIYEVLQYAE